MALEQTFHLGARMLVLAVLFTGCGSGGGGGGRDLSSFAREEVAVGEGENSVRVSWAEPTTHEDGSPIVGTLVYNLHYQTDSGDDAQSVPVGQVNSVLLRGLGNGSFGFAVTALETSGSESSMSEWTTVAVP